MVSAEAHYCFLPLIAFTYPAEAAGGCCWRMFAEPKSAGAEHLNEHLLDVVRLLGGKSLGEFRRYDLNGDGFITPVILAEMMAEHKHESSSVIRAFRHPSANLERGCQRWALRRLPAIPPRM
jgi:hypothetical protein